MMNGATTVLAIIYVAIGGSIVLSAAIVWLSNRINPQGIAQ